VTAVEERKSRVGRLRGLSWLDAVTLVVIAVALGFAFLTPPEVNQGNVARLFYLHVPAVSVAYLAFATTLVGSAGYLVTRKMGFDHLAVASAEVGVVFTGVAIVTGMVWAKPTWGVYWTWSARLTLTAIMLFVYVGYLALRRAIENPTARARRSAVFGMLSVVQIPVVHFSVVWWRDIHQLGTVANPIGIQMDGILFVAFITGFIAFTLVGVALVRRRYLLAGLETAGWGALDQDTGRLAGDAVAAPQLAAPMTERVRG